MDQQMREFRVTSCWFGKTVEEVERRRFVKLKRCVLEPAARGLRCRLKKSIRQRFAFTLKDSADGLCDDLKPADSHSYRESAGTSLKDNQQEQAKAQGLMWKKTCCSKIFEGRPRDRGAVIARTNTNTPSKCWIRTMILVDGVWVVESCSYHWVKIPKPIVHNEVPRKMSYEDTLPARLDAQSEDIRHIGDSHNDVLSRLTTLDKGLRDALLQQGEDLRKLIQNVRQDGRTLDDVQTLRFNEFRKGFLAHSAAVTADSMDFLKEFRALNAKVTSLDEQGEVSSSRPQPPPDDQNRGSGNTGGDNVRTTDIFDRVSGSMSREGRGRGRSGGNRSDYSKIRRYDSGGTLRRSFEDWLG
ncbi:hypothetical protein F511_27507 [Dorcoceras hygrometricum]|uniref:Uncharacterized protein n=1 Tax=Dorcoceras hygrometricum TaxID=472368 RepID=A0A2Z7DCS6_9LAMI|nr:hypothetical protein F511_27507 [Dorcoceras hygrometricum]